MTSIAMIVPNPQYFHRVEGELARSKGRGEGIQIGAADCKLTHNFFEPDAPVSCNYFELENASIASTTGFDSKKLRLGNNIKGCSENRKIEIHVHLNDFFPIKNQRVLK
jgi:hypothetical protein